MATETQIEVVMPQMGVSVSEGTITKWLKQEGEPIARDESLLEISTDKVDTEVPSPGEGVVAKILVQEGETVEVGTVLAVIAPEGAEVTPAAEPRRHEAPPEPATQAAADASEAAATEIAEPTPPTPAPAPAAARARRTGLRQRPHLRLPGRGADRVRARRRPERGPGHRHRRPRDEEGHPGVRRGRRPGRRPRRAHRPQAAPAPAAAAPAAAGSTCASRCACRRRPRRRAAGSRTCADAGEPAAGESFEPMTAMRKGIAEHMRRSLDTSAHVTSAIEVDMSKVVAIRAKLKKEYEAAYGVNPTYLSFIARATVETLREYPWINGEIRGDKIVTRNYVNLGFAVELADGKGLIVPVVKHAEGLNLLGIARGVSEIAARARNKKLMPDEVQGGTFTITNPGGYGTFHGTPVISQPQAGILGTYAVVKRPWVIQDELGQDVIAIRPIMNLTLTYDHRLVDGALAGRFLRDLREKLESWGESDY